MNVLDGSAFNSDYGHVLHFESVLHNVGQTADCSTLNFVDVLTVQRNTLSNHCSVACTRSTSPQRIGNPETQGCVVAVRARAGMVPAATRAPLAVSPLCKCPLPSLPSLHTRFPSERREQMNHRPTTFGTKTHCIAEKARAILICVVNRFAFTLSDEELEDGEAVTRLYGRKTADQRRRCHKEVAVAPERPA
jgi:hypothetical protein